MYDIKAVGYGDGSLGDYTIADGLFNACNSYAQITEIKKNIIKIDLENAVIGELEKFTAGREILIHVSGSKGATEQLGKYVVAKIELTDLNVLTLNREISFDVEEYYIQAVTLTNFDCLTLEEGAILSPQPYNPYKHVGGILALRCRNELVLNGGHIDLRDCGIPLNFAKELRPLTEQETAANGESDVSRQAGQENYLTATRFLLNAGDGATLIIAKKIKSSASSRIGNIETHGSQYCRGAKNSVGVLPSNITNLGGSTILIAADRLAGFSPAMIAKYRSGAAGKGLCRCYIASETKLRADEGLYAYDCLSDKLRLQRLTGIHDFGDGSFGDVENPKLGLNNYAQVTNIRSDGLNFSYINKTYNGIAGLSVGSLIMVQVIQKSAVEEAGRFVITKVLEDTGSEMTVDVPIPVVSLSEYLVQAISIPRFRKYKQSEKYSKVRSFDGAKGGVLAVAVSEELDLRGGELNVENKGGAAGYGRAGLAHIGNAQMYDLLPLGEGHGSVFVLAKKILIDENSRIGASYSGLKERLGGDGGGGAIGGGYKGYFDMFGEGSGGGYIGGGSSSEGEVGGQGGSGASGGTSENLLEVDSGKVRGGYGSNGESAGLNEGGRQGAHIFIVAGEIAGWNEAVISTGGSGGIGKVNGQPGAASYGGGGATLGSSGGSGGFAFIYCN